MKKKIIGLLILLVIYIISFFAGLGSFLLLPNDMNIIFKILIADVVATIVIWIFGVILKTASVYDPYWSIQTPVIFIALMIYYGNYNVGTIIFFIFIMFWAIRLTGNFIITFNDITYIDWRYVNIKKQTGKLYQIVNLLGINMMPTLLVFLASLPAFYYVINGNEFDALNIIGLFIMGFATIIELISDLNMHKFQEIRTSKSEIIRVGLWKYSRHPNYFGEILFWYGVLLVFLIGNMDYWYVMFGALSINLLFMFISIPLAEKKLITYKDGYLEYQKTTRRLIPLPKLIKRSDNE